MTKQEQKAREMIARLSTKELVKQFELTEKMNMTPELPTVRGWLMDELESRDAAAFEDWMDSDDESPRKYFAA